MIKQVIKVVQRLTAPIQRRLRLMVARGVVELVYGDTKLQGLQVSLRADELRDTVEQFAEYGFTSYPKQGAEAIVLLVGAAADHPVVVATDDRRYRPTDLAEGEVAIYTHEGTMVRCKAGPVLELGLSPTDFVALAPAVKSEIDAVLSYAQGIATAIQGGVPTPMDGGAALKASIVAALPTPPTTSEPAATQVKAK